MENPSLSVQDICAIIEKCSEVGVRSFKWGDLKVSFEDKRKPEPNTATPQGQGEVTPENFVDEEEAVRVDELQVKEDQFANALLENPALAEEILANPELMEQLLDEMGVTNEYE